MVVDWIAVLRAVERRLDKLASDSHVDVVAWAAFEAAADELERQRDAARGSGEEGRTSDRGMTPEARATRALWLLNPRSEGYSAIYEGTVEEFREVQREATESEAALRAELAEAKASAACDACAGMGSPVSGGLCMCGGTGLAFHAVARLRARLAERDAELTQVRDALGTGETGAGRVAVARAAHTAEQELAASNDDAREALISEVCMTWGNPTAAGTHLSGVMDALVAYERARRAKEKP